VIKTVINELQDEQRTLCIHAETLLALMREPFISGTPPSNIVYTEALYGTPSISIVLFFNIKLCMMCGEMILMNSSVTLVENSTSIAAMTLPSLHQSQININI